MPLWWNGIHDRLSDIGRTGSHPVLTEFDSQVRLHKICCLHGLVGSNPTSGTNIMKRKYREYTDEDVITAAKSVTSLSQLLGKLGLRKAGGNYSNMKRIVQRLEVDTSHWTGKGWNKGQRLRDWSEYTRAAYIKPHLIQDRGHKCQGCKLSFWRDKDIPLEIHHVDGDRTNNDLSNLSLLCPNCHALTDSWRKPNHSHVE